MRVIVILDANVIVANPRLRGSFWDQATEAIAGKRMEVHLPRFAMEEAIAVFGRRRDAKSVEIRAIERHASKAVRALLEKAGKEVLREKKRYESELARRLAEIGVMIDAPPRVGHDVLVRKAMRRRRPFDDDGSGYRDALHWASVLHLVRERYEGDDIVFVSNDRKAFGALGAGKASLHAHLLEELDEFDARPPYFQWLQTIDQLTVPGVFEEELKYDISVTGVELSGYVFDRLWDTQPLEAMPRSLGAGPEPAAIAILDIHEPSVEDILVRQYFEEERFRIDFTLYISFELALSFVPDDPVEDDVHEETRTVDFFADAHADMRFGQLVTDYTFSGLEMGTFTLVDHDPAADAPMHRVTYASGPVIRSAEKLTRNNARSET